MNLNDGKKRLKYFVLEFEVQLSHCKPKLSFYVFIFNAFSDAVSVIPCHKSHNLTDSQPGLQHNIPQAREDVDTEKTTKTTE